MRAIIYPSRLCGEVSVPSAKAIAHRALICAALADKPTKIGCIYPSEDVEATVDCLKALGAGIETAVGGFYVTPLKEAKENARLFCRESGSTLRFLLPVAAALGRGAELCGSGRLPERPIDELCSAVSQHGALVLPHRLPLKISGKMHGGRFAVSGNISSQFISGLLLALPLTQVDSYIVISNGIESLPYIKMTIAVMKSFGIEASFSANIITVKGGQSYKSPGEYSVEADWSSAAFFLCADALGDNSVRVFGTEENSMQGDSEIADILADKRRLINARHIPDLVPVAAVTSCFRTGTTVFCNAARLRMKESDRLESTTAMINSLGGSATAEGDRLTVFGTGSLSGGEVDSFGDHRIVMAAAIAASQCRKTTIINGCEAVAKSFPNFFEVFNSIGGNLAIEE